MKIKNLIDDEINYDGNKNIIKTIYRCIFISDYNIIIWIRLLKYFKEKKRRFFCVLIRNKIMKHYSMHIGINSHIGSRIKIPHPMGIVIGDGVVIGRDCTIYQNVTIGKKNGNLNNEYDYPTIGNNVTIFSGSVIVGKIYIGDNSIIAANSVVTSDVEENSIYAGIPARKIK